LDITTKEEYAAGSWTGERHDHLHECSFAGSVGSEQSHNSCTTLERNIVDGYRSGTIAFSDRFDVQHVVPLIWILDDTLKKWESDTKEFEMREFLTCSLEFGACFTKQIKD
jgi:hypothetical protein